MTAIAIHKQADEIRKQFPQATDYWIFTADNAENLAALVQENRALDWQTFGAPYKQGRRYCQVMVK